MTTVESIAKEYCPDCIVTGYKEVAKGLDYLRIDAEGLVQDYFPVRVHQVFFSILRTIPEIILCVSTGLNRPYFKAAIWSIKLVSLVTPMINLFLTGDFSEGAIDNALGDTGKNIREFFDRLRPAIAIYSLITLVAYALLGVLATPAYFMHTVIASAVTYLVIDSLVQNPIPQPI